jgi:hypothetical protein
LKQEVAQNKTTKTKTKTQQQMFNIELNNPIMATNRTGVQSFMKGRIADANQSGVCWWSEEKNFSAQMCGIARCQNIQAYGNPRDLTGPVKNQVDSNENLHTKVWRLSLVQLLLTFFQEKNKVKYNHSV